MKHMDQLLLLGIQMRDTYLLTRPGRRRHPPLRMIDEHHARRDARSCTTTMSTANTANTASCGARGGGARGQCKRCDGVRHGTGHLLHQQLHRVPELLERVVVGVGVAGERVAGGGAGGIGDIGGVERSAERSSSGGIVERDGGRVAVVSLSLSLSLVSLSLSLAVSEQRGRTLRLPERFLGEPGVVGEEELERLDHLGIGIVHLPDGREVVFCGVVVVVCE